VGTSWVGGSQLFWILKGSVLESSRFVLQS
jgi:hypothetical protein